MGYKGDFFWGADNVLSFNLGAGYTPDMFTF